MKRFAPGTHEGQGMRMDHQNATENYAVEQYLLGEMNPREREEFEEHFFSCAECAEAVRAGTYFADNTQFAFKDQAARPTGSGRQVVEIKARPRPTPWQRIAPPLAVAASILVAVLGFQTLRVKTAEPLIQAQLVTETVLRPAARGEESEVQVQSGQKTVVLRLDLNSDKAYPYYTVDLNAQSGKSILHAVSAPPADGAFQIASPVSKLPPGHYVVSVHGQTDPGAQPGPLVESSSFLVKE